MTARRPIAAPSDDPTYDPTLEPHAFRYPVTGRNGRCRVCDEYEEDGPHLAAPSWIDRELEALHPRTVDARLSEEIHRLEAIHRFRPCASCGGSPDIHNTNRGKDFIGHEYR